MSTLIAETDFGAIAAKVHCRKIGCEECAPLLRAQLIARGCNGKPNRHLVWTSLLRHDQTPEEACVDLKAAIRLTLQSARYRLKLPPERRWKIPGGYKSEKRQQQVIRYAREDDKAGLTSIAHFWTTERHESGWPHIHMLARAPHIPQEWLSWQMGKRLNSPVVWINAIHDLGRQVGYIVGYITKEEHRFGTSKRYSMSRNYKRPSDNPYVPLVPPWMRLVHKAVPLNTILNRWAKCGHMIWKAGRRWHGWGEMVDPVTGEICPRPPNAEPYEVADAWDA